MFVTISQMSHTRFGKSTLPLTLVASLLIGGSIATSSSDDDVCITFLPSCGAFVLTLSCGVKMCAKCRDERYFKSSVWMKNNDLVVCPNNGFCSSPKHSKRGKPVVFTLEEVKETFDDYDATIAKKYKAKLKWQNSEGLPRRRTIPKEDFTKEWIKQNREFHKKGGTKSLIGSAKSCPECQTLITLDRRKCKNLVCPSCQYHFCWMCGLEYAPYKKKELGYCTQAVCLKKYNKMKSEKGEMRLQGFRRLASKRKRDSPVLQRLLEDM